jgi:penicillin amidase
VALKRALRSLNLALLIVLLLAAIAVYWYAWRPLAQTSGIIAAPISQRATVERDALGVPHIVAASIDDALFLQGYVTAQERLFQMDALRRYAGGRLAEVLGPAMVESDREARRYRLDRVAQAQAALLPPADRAALAAYTRGVNCFIETHRGRLPLEFALLRYDPGPWTVKDSLLIALYMYRELTVTWRDKIFKRDMLAAGDPAKVNLLFPPRLAGGILPGSNAWVLAGSRTASGLPLLANDPHLQYSIPSLWFMVHLRAPGLDVSGVALPGLPCVIIGHNDRIAWGETNLGFDVQDFYEERIDLRTGRYIFRDHIEQALGERELIAVKGAPPVEFAQWVTRHGPVWIDGAHTLALRWTAYDAGSTAFPMLDLDRARDWPEFQAALARFPGPAQNFVYADTAGHIGYHAAGRLPIRRNFVGDVPVDGSSGNFEWDGYIPFDQLPHAYDPPSRIIVTANQNPFPYDYPFPVHGKFAAPYRAERIYSLLTSRSKWTAPAMLGVQTDVYSSLAHYIARRVVEAARRRPAAGDAAAAVSLLAAWDGRMDKGPAPLIAILTYEHLRQAMAERAAPGQSVHYAGADLGGAAYAAAPQIVEDLLRNQPADWFADYDGLLLRCFEDALDEARRLGGSNLARWDYGWYNQLLIAHPVGNSLPLVARYFNIGPVAHAGSPVTVNQATRRLGPSMRMGVDLADLDHSYLNIVAGQSGHILSRHYKDQWDAYSTGVSFPMQFHKVDAKDMLVFEPSKD